MYDFPHDIVVAWIGSRLFTSYDEFLMVKQFFGFDVTEFFLFLQGMILLFLFSLKQFIDLVVNLGSNGLISFEGLNFHYDIWKSFEIQI